MPLKIQFGERPDPLPESLAEDLPPVDLTLDPPPADDPQPAPAPRFGGGKPPAPAPPTKAQQKAIAEDLDSLLKLGALLWSVGDPTCGGVLNDQSKALAAAFTDLLADNPRLLAFLRGSGWMGKWGALVLATAPVAKAIYRHHLDPPAPEEDEFYGDPTAPRPDQFLPYIPRVGNPQVA